jgi:hypothetical protein
VKKIEPIVQNYASVVGRTLQLFLITFFSTMTGALNIDQAVNQHILRRQNYVVIFRYEQKIFAHSENYVHHLLFDLPDQATFLDATFTDLAKYWNVSKMAQGDLRLDSASTQVRKSMSFEAYHLQQIVNNIYQIFEPF